MRLAMTVPWGDRLVVTGTSRGISGVEFNDSSTSMIDPGPVPEPLKMARIYLEAYFAGNPLPPSPVLSVTPPTPFINQVWDICREIPYGQTRTYGWVAAQIGRPGGGRAVGQALKRNPVPIFIPCHRVVSSNGPGGFSPSPALKIRLLGLEKGEDL